MKILIVGRAMNHLSGQPLYCYETAMEMKRQGHEVAVMSDWSNPFDDGHKLKENLENAGIDCINFDAYEADVIYLSEANISSPDVLGVVPKLRGKIINIIHTGAGLSSRWEAPLLSNRVSKYVAIRQDIVTHLVNTYNIPETKISMIHNGIDLNRFKPVKNKQKNEKHTIVVPATLDLIRNKFLNHLIDTETNSRLIFVGRIFEAQFDTSKVEILPPTFNIEEIYKSADEVAGILMGRVNLEAAAMGIPSRIYDPETLERTDFPSTLDAHFDIKNVVKELLELAAEPKIEVNSRVRFSVFTPTHDTTYLRPAWDSLKAQTFTDWEWILVPNNGVIIPPDIAKDSRVKIFPYESNKVGDLKAFACSKATGEFVAEFDHDDMLTPDCLEEVAKYDTDFIYSNCFQINNEWEPQLWSQYTGWEWRPHTYEGHDILEAVSPEPYPSNFSRIWFAPNHIRVWKKSFYDAIGGHNPEFKISDDHDMCARSYLYGSITHIDKPLYVYRVHGENSWLKLTQEIQDTMWQNHDKYFIPMQEKWCRDNSLRIIDLGGAIGAPPGYETYDRHNADVVGDLNNDWHLTDNSVGLLRAHDIIEHLKDPIHTMNEAYRVLVHGGVFDILVPSTKGEGAWCDPTHVSFWNRRSFRYYTEAIMRQYIEPECNARFQIVKLVDINLWEGIPYVQAQLLAVKDGMRYHGELMI